MEHDDLEMENPILVNNNNNNNNNYRHSSSSLNRRLNHKITTKNLVVSVLAGLSLAILLPIGHMLLFEHFWGTGDNEVDRKECSCSCWDTVFKGTF